MDTYPCCREFEEAARLSRRRFLLGMGATSTTAVVATMFGDAFRQTTFGATPGGNVLVVISLRGGIDGLGMVVPHGDPGYYAGRPTIAVPKTSVVAADAMFGLHPKMAPLEWAFTGGELAAVHAVGLAVPNRSHFAATEEVEDADPTSSKRRGWVNRMIGLETGAEPADQVALNNTVLPTMLSGPTPALATDRLADITLVGAGPHDDAAWQDRRRTALNRMWRSSSVLAGATASALRTVDELAPVTGTTYVPTDGVTYPSAWPATDLSNALKDTAQLIKADIGTEVVSVDFGSWDMHYGYGELDWGSMQSMVGGFAGALDAFLRDLGPDLRQRVTVVTISEFGRRVAENGDHGLDHGWGNMMLVAGGGVKGGQYYGKWPGLDTSSETNGDLTVTTDYRNVFGEVLTRRFPDRSLTQVFPGLSYDPLGFMS
jgi:uncharacterized protein (DUF1501 family)